MKAIRLEMKYKGTYELPKWYGIATHFGFFMSVIGLEGPPHEHKGLDKPYNYYFTYLGYKKFGIKIANAAAKKKAIEIRFKTLEITKDHPAYVWHNKHQIIVNKERLYDNESNKSNSNLAVC